MLIGGIERRRAENIPIAQDLYRLVGEEYADYIKDVIGSFDDSFAIVRRSAPNMILGEELREFKKRFPKAETVYGRSEINEDEAVVSYDFMKKYSLTVEEILGQTITVEYEGDGAIAVAENDGGDGSEGERNDVVLTTKTIAGVFSEEYGEIFLPNDADGGDRDAVFVNDKADADGRHQPYMFPDYTRNIIEIYEEMNEFFGGKYPPEIYYEKMYVLKVKMPDHEGVPGSFRPASIAQSGGNADGNGNAALNGENLGENADEASDDENADGNEGGKDREMIMVRVEYHFFTITYPDCGSPVAQTPDARSADVLKNQKDPINQIMLTVIVLLSAAMMTNIGTILLYDVKRKGVYFGDLKAHGMTEGKIFRVILRSLRRFLPPPHA
ncbi:MAG: hypothetical protein LBP79_00130 [Clostridiales bacterium]|nr:hypothetical protein [Clostridiales bacterium]